MLHNGPLVLKERAAPIDYALVDPATRPPVQEVEGFWSSSRRKKDPVTARVETHAFDPYTQSRPDLYTFARDSNEPRVWYSQRRVDGKYLGTVETTATGFPRQSVLRIDWHKNGGADVEFQMVSDNANEPPICEGYCKKTDLGSAVPGELGRLGWVAVATRLAGRDILQSQTEHLFSLPVFEAIATGVAYGLWDNDSKIRDMHPTLGTQAPAAIGSLAAESIHGVGAERWTFTSAGDTNELVRASQSYELIEVQGFARDKAMEVVHYDPDSNIGVIFPIKNGIDELNDGLTIQRMVIGEKPVAYADYPDVKHITRYEAAVFSRLHASGNVPVAVLSVDPLAVPDVHGKLELKGHITRPKIGSQWVTPGRQSVTVDQARVDLATQSVSAWDPRLHATVEAAMHKLKMGAY